MLCWNNFNKFIQINIVKNKPPENIPSVKLLSFNVRLFNYYNWLHIKSAHDNILTYIKKEHAYLICLQEFFTVSNTVLAEDTIKKLLSATPYTHIHYSDYVPGSRNFGIATFSHFPIVYKGVIEFQDSPHVSIYSDIKINVDTIRVYNCHLQSTRLEKDKFNFVDSLLFNYKSKHIREIKKISHRLKDAYIKRARQVDILSYHIRNSPYPVLLCGDFNDTPVSYTYHKLKGNLSDAFLKSGKGIGNTYFGNFPSFRIDFIMHSKSLTTYGFLTKKVKLSDHFPIICNFYFNDNTEL